MTPAHVMAVTLRSLLLRADEVLRGARESDSLQPVTRSLRDLLLMTLAFGMVYGAVMGTFGGIAGDRPLQVLYSAVKVPMLLVVSFGLSLPSFFILNTILGVRSDFPRAVASLMGGQAALTIVLASLAPLTAFWYVSVLDYDRALVFNGVMFAVATLAGQWVLRRSYRALLIRNPRHRVLLRTWLAMYTFVAIQMAWVLRPFVGAPGAPVTFVRHGAWGNAYVEVAKIAWHSLGR